MDFYVYAWTHTASRFDGRRMAAFAKANGICHVSLRPLLLEAGWRLEGKRWVRD